MLISSKPVDFSAKNLTTKQICASIEHTNGTQHSRSAAYTHSVALKQCPIFNLRNATRTVRLIFVIPRDAVVAEWRHEYGMSLR